MTQQAGAPPDGEDYDKLKRNAPAIVTDIALGVLFFIAAKLSDLRTAALVAAGAGVALYGVQWVLDRVLKKKIDLLGGLALFGIVMLLISAGFSWLFESELAVQLKSTYLGLLVAGFFALDALRGGRYLGQRLSLYVAYNDVDARRLAWSFAAVGATMALVNAAIAVTFSKDTWLWYTLWGDLVLVTVLAMWAIKYARRPPALAAAGGPAR
ncbi:MAG: septation protein IspZ [Burkholderiales bacterium]|jgi:intracellular septation protein A|nr:septation protein IspZ [Burkholderiales bacterium]